MTRTPPASHTHDAPPPFRTGRGRALLRILAVASCLPYLSLKAAWIAGSHIGIPDGSVLLDHPTLMAVANSGTVLMDGTVIVLALLLTQAWGRRVRAWVLALPMWVATGLLLPIMAGFPLQLLRIAERTDDFYALQALDALFVAAAVAGVLLLAFRRTGGRASC